MAEVKTERYERIAVEEAYLIPEIAALQGGQMPGRSGSKMREYIMESLLDLGEGRIKTMDEDGIATQVCLLAGIAIQDIDPVQGNDSPRLRMTASPKRRANIPAASQGSPASRPAIRCAPRASSSAR